MLIMQPLFLGTACFSRDEVGETAVKGQKINHIMTPHLQEFLTGVEHPGQINVDNLE